MAELIFVCIFVYLFWKIFQGIFGLLLQIVLFFIKLVCLSIIIMVLYFIVINVKLDIPKTISNTTALSHSYAIPVPGQKGMVRSPFSNDGLIDIRGFSSGTVIKDPYSANNLIVP